jgi:hypothetical protein
MTLLIVVRKKDYCDLLFFFILKKLNLKAKNYETHQDIFNKAKVSDPLKEIIVIYEESKFYKKNLNFINFIKLLINLSLSSNKVI